MSFGPFSTGIDHSFIGRFVERKMQQIKGTDPRRFYVENVRSFFGFPRWLAKLLCYMAARDGYLEKRIGFLCPNSKCHRMVDSMPADAIMGKGAELVECKTCLVREAPQSTFKRDEFGQIEFYVYGGHTHNAN